MKILNELTNIIYDKKISRIRKEQIIYNLIRNYLNEGREDLAIEVAKAFEKLEKFEKNNKDLKRCGWL